MNGVGQQEPAYVLHRRPWRESSLLVDLFTLNHGRIRVIGRGGNSARSPLKAQLQPFQPLLLDWSGRSELKTLTQVEVLSGPALVRPPALYSGLYLNELLQRILQPGDACPDLFAAYIDAISGLADGADMEPLLRRFEKRFAAALGYDFAWDLATDTGTPVEADRYYGYHPEQGILASPPGDVCLRHLPGQTLLALAAGDLDSVASRRVAKQVMRVLVDYLLQGRPLNSRRLFTQLRGEENES